MLIVLGEIKFGEGALDKALGDLKTMVTASRAEDGCISYGYSQNLLDPSMMQIVEKWVDADALAHHMQTPHMAAFQAAIADVDFDMVELSKYEADDGAPLM